MKNFIFASPFYLWFLFFIPVLTILFLLFVYWRKKRLFKFIDSKRAQDLLPHFSFSRKLTKHILSITSLAFLILALARPQALSQKLSEKTKGLEVVLMVDVSQSMLVSDVKPNRLDLMKAQLSHFVETAQGRHRIGLIAFAGSAFFISPLTQDLSLIKNHISSLSVNTVSSQGTNFRAALERAEKAFKGGSLNRPDVTRVLIIASDGENHEVGALEKIRSLREQDVHVFTLGFGTKSGGVVPFGTEQEEQVISQFKPRSLKEFSKIGKGVFYHVDSSVDVVDQLNQDLNQLQQFSFSSKDL